MTQKIKKVKQMQQNGEWSSDIPIGANAENVDLANGKNLQETIGTINVDTDGNIAEQLTEIQLSLGDINSILDDINGEII